MPKEAKAESPSSIAPSVKAPNRSSHRLRGLGAFWSCSSPGNPPITKLLFISSCLSIVREASFVGGDWYVIVAVIFVFVELGIY